MPGRYRFKDAYILMALIGIPATVQGNKFAGYRALKQRAVTLLNVLL